MLPAIVETARPRQWIKNLACFAGLLFSGRLTEGDALLWAVLAFVGFCLLSSGVYLFNDICDRHKDRGNPLKSHRPIASGRLSVGIARVASALLLAGGMLTLVVPGWRCALMAAVYLVMNLLYSARLKHTVIVDVMCIALGFVLRMLAGVFAVGVLPTAWILLCMFFLSLFLGFAKRRGELAALRRRAGNGRPVLAKYNLRLLDSLLAMTATMAVVFYALYTVTGRDTPALVVTIPLVVYGVLRYMVLVLVEERGESPDEILARDRMLHAAIGAWALLCAAVLYGDVVLVEFKHSHSTACAAQTGRTHDTAPAQQADQAALAEQRVVELRRQNRLLRQLLHLSRSGSQTRPARSGCADHGRGPAQ